MFFIENGGTHLHCTSMGSGPPLVLSHGLVFGSMASWYFSVAAILAQRFRVTLYDQRGHGKSALTTTGYDMATMASDLGAVIDHTAGDEPVVLIGHSYGALVALHYSLKNNSLQNNSLQNNSLQESSLQESSLQENFLQKKSPQKNALATQRRVRSLVLIDAPLPASHYVFPSIAEFTSSEILLAQFPNFLRAQLTSGGRRAVRMQERLEFLMLRSSLRADVAAAGDIADAELQALDLPVLCIYGRHSDCAAAGERLAAQLPRAQLQWLDCGHYVVQEAPAALIDALNNFTDL